MDRFILNCFYNVLHLWDCNRALASEDLVIVTHINASRAISQKVDHFRNARKETRGCTLVKGQVVSVLRKADLKS